MGKSPKMFILNILLIENKTYENLREKLILGHLNSLPPFTGHTGGGGKGDLVRYSWGHT